MCADYRTPAGGMSIATVLILAAGVVLFATASVLTNDILRYYLYGAAAASVGCSIVLYATSKLYGNCARAVSAA